MGSKHASIFLTCAYLADEGARLARRSGDAEGRIARGAAGIWDEFDGSTPRSNGFAPRRASDPMSLRRTRRSPPEDFTFYVVVRTLLSYAKKIISYRRFVRRIRTHPRAQSAPPCGARPCTNPFFAPSRAILVTMAIETVRARLSREPEPRVPRAFPAAHPVFSSASHPGGSFHPCGSAGADARSATRPRCSAPRASRAAARSPS